MSKVSTFLWYDDQAQEAAEFYTSIVPNSRVTGTTPGPDGKPLVVTFELDGQQYAALNGGPAFNFTEATSIYLDCETQEEVDEYWARLTEGGEEGPCGWLKDRYGLSWQVVPTVLPRLLGDPDPKVAAAVGAAFRVMSKLDIKTLEDAASQA